MSISRISLLTHHHQCDVKKFIANLSIRLTIKNALYQLRAVYSGKLCDLFDIGATINV